MTKQELENYLLNFLKEMHEYKYFEEYIKKCGNDIDKAIKLVFTDYADTFSIWGGFSGPDTPVVEYALRGPSGYMKIWSPENKYQYKPPDLVLNIKGIFALIRAGENKQPSLL